MKYNYYMGDFETTVYKGQERTDVWAAALVPFYTEDVKIYHSIDEMFEALTDLPGNIVVYFHNLKFDGSFWLNFLMNNSDWKQAFEGDETLSTGKFLSRKDMPNNTYNYCISDMGQWYNIVMKHRGRIIELRDSLKLLPFSVKAIGKSFATKHKKMDMEYEGFRYPGCEITEEEQEYIKNDVLVVKEALEILFEQGHNKLTIGSCCLEDFRKGYFKEIYEENFPNLYEIDSGVEDLSMGEYIHKSYRGGWCYYVPEKANKILHNGFTADVNSLYPSMMHSQSGNYYPTGIGWLVKKPTIEALKNIDHREIFYFVRFRCRFYLREGKLPFIQIKNNLLYPGNKNLTTSDVYDKKTNKYYRYYTDRWGEEHDSAVELTMTWADFELFLEHYIVQDMEIYDAMFFQAQIGLFDNYINYWKEIKMNSTGAMRQLAKLFLNNLYGKMASNTNSSFKVAYLDEDGSNAFYEVTEHSKKPGYIPIGSAITSYSRCFTIRAAQANFYGAHKKGFVYADTDSIHCDIDPKKAKGINVHPTEFCCWKLESFWDTGLFVRQKTYIEHVTHTDGERVNKPYYDIKCAGMPDRSKSYFLASMEGDIPAYSECDEDERIFFYDENEKPIKRELKDFTVGLCVPGKLAQRQVPGGALLCDEWYEMREGL